ncbi:MAG TPA: hypothetical protein VH496_11550 [Mycobacterium sp.]|jgi:uncharacterized protein HemX
MNTTGWIIVAVVVALVLIAAAVLLANWGRTKRHRAEAGRLREHAQQESVKVERREALADETAARARAAKAEAEAKAAEAARLEERASAHQDEVASSREELDKHWEHADRLDPPAKSADDGTTSPEREARRHG